MESLCLAPGAGNGIGPERSVGGDSTGPEISHAVRIVLPWPPSVNDYWQRTKSGGIRVSDRGVQFREQCIWEARAQKADRHMTGPLRVDIVAFMPDKLRRDLDNILKATLDGLTHSGVWGDDSQVVDLRIRKGPHVAGMLKVEVTEA